MPRRLDGNCTLPVWDPNLGSQRGCFTSRNAPKVATRQFHVSSQLGRPNGSITWVPSTAAGP